MNESTVLSIFSWLGEHPVLSGFFIFFIALIESLAIVGIIVPGVIFMLIIGAYLATDQFSFFYAILLTFSGAVAGDAISYYIGYRYKTKLTTIWPLSRYPDTFKKGIQFFKQHGIKSVILGRFIGPIRPIIPAIAGMFQMPQKQFFISNVLSALVWAPFVLLPGYVIGLSLEFASDITARLLVLLVLFAAILWLIFWMIKLFYLHLLPRFDNGISLILNWSHKHPLPGKIPGILSGKHYSYKITFILLSSVFILFSFIFFALPFSTNLVESYKNVDIFFNDLFLNLNSPTSNYFINSILNLLNIYWVIALSMFILFLLLWKKYTTLLRYYIFTFIITVLLQIILNNYFKIDPNNNLLSISTYLFLTFVLTFNSSTRRKILYYGICYALIAAMALAQLYHGSESLISLIQINLFSLFWITILSSTYRHHCKSNQFTHQIQRKFGLFFLVIIILNIVFLPTSFQFEPRTPNTVIIEKNIWEKHLSLELPLHRKGFINSKKNHFNIQWVDSREVILKTISRISTLNNTKWKVSNYPGISEILQFLNPQADIESLAVFPHLNDGAYEQLRFTRTVISKTGKKEIFVIRLWKTNYKVKRFNPETIAKPLWHGTLTKLVIVKRLGIQILQSRLIEENQFEKFILSFKQLENTILLKNKNNINIVLLSFFLNQK